MSERWLALALAALMAGAPASADPPPQTQSTDAPPPVAPVEPSQSPTSAAAPSAPASTDPASPAAAPTGPSVDEILSSNDTGEYAKTRKCLHTDSIRQTRVLNESYIVFETTRTERWLAKLAPSCPGLRPDSLLAFDTRNPQLCAWDSVRVVLDQGGSRPGAAFLDGMGPTGALGSATPFGPRPATPPGPLPLDQLQRLGPPCRLPAFQQVTQAQVDALREALKIKPAH